MNLEQFLRSSRDRAYVREPGFETLYVRKSIRQGIDLELATVRAEKPGSGALTGLLDRLEPHYSILCETIDGDRLIAFLKRRGYTRWGQAQSIDMARAKG